MIRLITAGACALLLAGCTADAKTGGNAPANKTPANKTPANNTPAVAADAMAKFELGKDI